MRSVQRLAIPRSQDQREQLGFVADLGQGNEAGRASQTARGSASDSVQPETVVDLSDAGNAACNCLSLGTFGRSVHQPAQVDVIMEGLNVDIVESQPRPFVDSSRDVG
jgi:hypothetical protein